MASLLKSYTRHNTFISYHHADESEVADFINRFDHEHDVLISRGIGASMAGDVINSTDADYIKRRIRELYLRDSTVTLVMVGAETWGRRFVGEIDDAELGAGDGIVDRSGPADPVVHDRGVVLGAEHHRRLGEPVGEVERVGADRLVVPAASGHEVDGLRLAPHHPAAVGPQDPGVRVGDRDDEVSVLGRAAQVLLDVLHGRLQRRVPPDRRDLGLVGERRLLHVDRDRRLRPRPRGQDLGADWKVIISGAYQVLGGTFMIGKNSLADIVTN